MHVWVSLLSAVEKKARRTDWSKLVEDNERPGLHSMTIFLGFFYHSSVCGFWNQRYEIDFESVLGERFGWKDGLEMTRKNLIVFAVLVFFKSSHQHSHGAPFSRCETLAPSHQGIGSQDFPSIFDIIPSVDMIRPGDKMSVEIRSSAADRSFRGFILQARTLTNPFQIVGQFQEQQPSSVVFRDCSGLRTTITHSSNEQFPSRTFEWMAPSEFEGSVRFQ